MVSARLDITREAFEAIEKGDYEVALSHTTPDYTHHVVAMGIDTVGPEGFRSTVIPLAEQAAITQRLDQVIESGDFTVVTTRVTSTMAPAEGTLVHVLRWEADRVAEVWDISSPLPAAS